MSIKIAPASIEEDRHWWFSGRTRSILNMLDRLVAPDGSKRVLDIGCGAGNMIHHLARYGSVVGVDSNPRPLAIARQRGYAVWEASADDLPFADESFTLISLLDTLEHCQDDMAVLREAFRVCQSGGYLIITVPAFKWLWGHNDVLNQHKRRYSSGELREKVLSATFGIRRITYNNSLLLPMAAAIVLLRRLVGTRPDLGSPHFDNESYQVEMEPAPPLLNGLLTGVTWTEAQLLRWINLPAGTSIICIAHRSESV